MNPICLVPDASLRRAKTTKDLFSTFLNKNISLSSC